MSVAAPKELKNKNTGISVMFPSVYSLCLLSFSLASSPVTWGGGDYDVALVPPLHGTDMTGLDGPARVYPAIDAHGSILVSAGGIYVRSGGDICADSVCMRSSIGLLIDKVCNGSCAGGQMRQLPTCSCSCEPGYTGTTCREPLCMNGGRWDIRSSACICSGYLTPDSMCVEIRCPHGMIEDDDGLNCTCVSPACGWVPPRDTSMSTGLACYDMDGMARISCMGRHNYGVHGCYDGGVCVCAPFFQNGRSSPAILRWAVGLDPISFATHLAPICCTGQYRCEEYFHVRIDRENCTLDALCCSRHSSSERDCVRSLCWWANGTCVLPAVTGGGIVGFWRSSVELFQGDGWADLASAEMKVPYATLQMHRWPTISTFIDWGGGDVFRQMKMMVELHPQTLQLFPLSSDTGLARWVADRALVATNLLRMEVVSMDPRVSGPDIGSVFRVWSNRDFCLCDHRLAIDEIRQLYRGVQDYDHSVDSLYYIRVDDRRVSIMDCGLFQVSPGQIRAYNRGGLPLWINTDGQMRAVLSDSRPSYSVTLPLPGFSPLDPDVIEQCQWLVPRCRIAEVLGECASVACAIAVLQKSVPEAAREQLVADCLQCLPVYGIVEAASV